MCSHPGNQLPGLQVHLRGPTLEGVLDEKLAPEVLDHPKNLENFELLRMIQTEHEYTLAELQLSNKWTNRSPWIWYSSFVAGIWIVEQRRAEKIAGLSGCPGSRTRVFLLVLAFCGASYPFTDLLTKMNPVWWLMEAATSILGSDAGAFWHIAGASALVQFVATSDLLQICFSHKILRFFGQISFSLYLTHIPILYTFTCGLFLWLHDVSGSYNGAALLAFLLSLPVMLSVAILFERVVDRIAIQKSSLLGKMLLGDQ